MGSRKTALVNNEYYHIYNRGVDKREIFLDKNDLFYFFDGVKEFNGQEPIGSLYLKNLDRDKQVLISQAYQLVNIVAFCLNPNHFHLILKQNSDKGIEKFMQRLGTSYTKHFNHKNNRTGALFQGKFKSKHIDNNEYLLYLSAYVNFNDKIHGIESPEKITFSSLKEYTENMSGICEKSIILDQFKNREGYKKFLSDSIAELIRQKEGKKELEE